ncbi:MAG: redoxin domain-containing protein [Bryobacteraceae bacterium]
MKLFNVLAFATVMSTLVLGQSNNSAASAAPPSTKLKVGDMAPDFTLPSTTGDKVTLSSFRGKQTVVLAFFPAAFTGGCTKEMQTYQLGIDKFKGTDAAVFGISEDNTPSQKEFANKLGLKFPLLSDFATRKVAEEYGVFVPEYGVANRVTFVVDKDGKISYIEAGKDAVATLGAGEACSRLAHKGTGASQ